MPAWLERIIIAALTQVFKDLFAPHIPPPSQGS